MEIRSSSITQERVRQNVRQLRQNLSLDLADLARRVAAVGHPISVSGLSKLENGQRRITVDDLVALAIALEATPNRLLLPDPTDTGMSKVSPNLGPLSTSRFWAWAAGKVPIALPDTHFTNSGDDASKASTANSVRRFIEFNAPPPRDGSETDISLTRLTRYLRSEAFDRLHSANLFARSCGWNPSTTHSLLELSDALASSHRERSDDGVGEQENS